MSETLGYFQLEAQERLQRLNAALLQLEQSATDAAVVNDLFREAHSLKGAAGIAGLQQIAELCHAMETVFARMRDGDQKVSTELVDRLLATTEMITRFVDSAAEQPDADVAEDPLIAQLLSSIDSSVPTEATPPCGAPASSTSGVSRNGATATETNDPPIMTPRPAENAEASKTRSTDSGRCEAERAARNVPSTPRTGTGHIRVAVETLECLQHTMAELLVAADRLRNHHFAMGQVRRSLQQLAAHGARGLDDQATLRRLNEQVRQLTEDYAADLAAIEPLFGDLHDAVATTRMQPVDVLFDGLPTFVRSYGRQSGKKVRLEIDDDDTHADRSVVERLRDPMIHLVRNAIAHGIENPEERERGGKPCEGTIRLSSRRDGDRIRIICQDDGAGIDVERVARRARERGMVPATSGDRLAADQVLAILTTPGFSTCDNVSDLAGRGVGLDVVAAQIRELGGQLHLEFEPGQYSRFILTIPATISTLQGVCVAVDGWLYIVPSRSVERTVQIKGNQIERAAGRLTVARINDQTMTWVPLRALLGPLNPVIAERPERALDLVAARNSNSIRSSSSAQPALQVRTPTGPVLVGVDRILGVQSYVAKTLPTSAGSLPGVIAATITDAGVPALIVEPGILAHSSSLAESASTPTDLPAPETTREPARVLVVDDSLTTRMMEKSILEAAGYDVDLASSGEDALTKLGVETYGLMLSDVEMPGLNGFELTRRVRESKPADELPIVIVSSRGSAEEQREGLEAGADAYIVKGEFTQQKLLDTVARLVRP